MPFFCWSGNGSKYGLSGIPNDQVFEFIGIARLDGKMGLQKNSNVLNGLANGFSTLAFTDSRGDTAHQAVPFFLGDFFRGFLYRPAAILYAQIRR